jgi:hypothetical protein
MAIGAAVTLGGKKLQAFWEANKTPIQTALESLDERLEKKIGADLPDSWQTTYHKLVQATVAWVDSYAGSTLFWRQVIRFILSLSDTGKAAALINEIQSLNWTTKLEEQMSPDLKAVVNQIKQEVAEKIVVGQTQTAIPVEVRTNVVMNPREDIQVAAKGVKKMDEPVTKELLERLIAESAARQAKLGGTK